MVNLPAFRLWAFDTAGPAGRAALEMRVIVGKAAGTPTPLFVEQMRYLEFQPNWNVPNSIVRSEIPPNLVRDPAYLRRTTWNCLVATAGFCLPIRPTGWRRWAPAKPGQATARRAQCAGGGQVRHAQSPEHLSAFDIGPRTVRPNPARP